MNALLVMRDVAKSDPKPSTHIPGPAWLPPSAQRQRPQPRRLRRTAQGTCLHSQREGHSLGRTSPQGGPTMNSRAMTSIRLVYEAHATITDNEAGIATGWLQGVLSATGRLQARELADRRRDDGIAAVFTSDLHPAMSTARIAFTGKTQSRSTTIPRLRECHYGRLNGRPQEALAPLRGTARRRAPPRRRELPRGSPPRTSSPTWPTGGRQPHSAGCSLGQPTGTGLPTCRRLLEDLVRAPASWQPGWEHISPPADRTGEPSLVAALEAASPRLVTELTRARELHSR